MEDIPPHCWFVVVGAACFAVAAAVFDWEVLTGFVVDVTDESFFAAGGAVEFFWCWVEGVFVIHEVTGYGVRVKILP